MGTAVRTDGSLPVTVHATAWRSGADDRSRPDAYQSMQPDCRRFSMVMLLASSLRRNATVAAISSGSISRRWMVAAARSARDVLNA